MFAPKNLRPFYDKNIVTTRLFQGDILSSEEIGLKSKGEITSPDFYVIITKSCDLAFRKDVFLPKNQNISILPLLTFKILKGVFHKKLKRLSYTLGDKIVLLGLINFSLATNSITRTDHIDNLVKDNLSKFMYIPPDGMVLKEPMIVDFDLIIRLDGSDQDLVKRTIDAKKLQLSSPFREKLAQRFALHYMSIGIEDDEIRQKHYISSLKAELKNSK